MEVAPPLKLRSLLTLLTMLKLVTLFTPIKLLTLLPLCSLATLFKQLWSKKAFMPFHVIWLLEQKVW